MEKIMQIKNMKKSFDDNLILNDISCDIYEKEVLCIIGPSGSGKSTLLRCLNLLEDLDSGEIIFDGIDITSEKVDINKLRTQIEWYFNHLIYLIIKCYGGILFNKDFKI